MRVRFTSRGRTDNFAFDKGDVVDLPYKKADVYIRCGLAEEVKEQKTKGEVKQDG